LYNLEGGILQWNGHTIEDQPRLKVFTAHSSPGELADFLYTGMDLERGAWRFYSAVLKRHAEAAFAAPIDLLARAEEGHARLLYRFWAVEQVDPPPFEEVYGSMAGDIVEGGQDVASLLDNLARLADDPCLDIIEMALGIEFAAYDLYRSMAHRFSGTTVEEPFLAIAQAEKEHMRIASEALPFCV
jgi:rubrerythrin